MLCGTLAARNSLDTPVFRDQDFRESRTGMVRKGSEKPVIFSSQDPRLTMPWL